MKAKSILSAVSIRRAVPDDAEAIEQVHVQTYKTSYRGFLPDDFLDNLEVNEEHVKHMRKHIADDEIYVAVYQNRIVGFAYPLQVLASAMAACAGMGFTSLKRAWIRGR